MNRQQAEKRGRGAETLACWYLRLHGWHILARRARVPGGEVDIVARRGRTLAFVEVKARASEEAAAFSLDEWRLRRVVVAAERLAPRYMREGDDVRIDAIFIVPAPLAAAPRQRLARVTKPGRKLGAADHEPPRRRADGPAGADRHRRGFDLRADARRRRSAAMRSTIISPKT